MSVTPETKYQELNLEDRILKSKNLHVAIVTTSNMGHMMPAFKIAEALVEAGHQVTFLTAGTKKAKELGAKLFEGTQIKYIMHDLLPE